MRITIIGLLIIIFITACYYDNEEYLYPELPVLCDTTALSYISDIQPIIESNCIMCHSKADAAFLGGNIILEDFSDVDARSAMILKSVNHEVGSPPMPKDNNKLVKCDLMIIEAWINQGKNEN